MISTVIRNWRFAREFTERDPEHNAIQHFMRRVRLARDADKQVSWAWYPITNRKLIITQRFVKINMANKRILDGNPICRHWHDAFLFDRERWLRVPSAVIRSGPNNSPRGHDFYVEVRGEVVYEFAPLPDICTGFDLHGLRVIDELTVN